MQITLNGTPVPLRRILYGAAGIQESLRDIEIHPLKIDYQLVITGYTVVLRMRDICRMQDFAKYCDCFLICFSISRLRDAVTTPCFETLTKKLCYSSSEELILILEWRDKINRRTIFEKIAEKCHMTSGEVYLEMQKVIDSSFDNPDSKVQAECKKERGKIETRGSHRLCSI